MRRAALAWLVLLALLCGCAANADPLLPTPPLETRTPSPTPTVPTRTPSAIPPSFTPYPTDTPPATLAPGQTPTALMSGALPTTVRYAPTATKPNVQPGALAIEYFTTTVTSARPGDKVKLYWSVRGAESAIIYRLRPDGTRDYTWQVGQAGSQDVLIGKDDKEQSRFVLTVSDAYTRIEKGLTITLQCATYAWFFTPDPGTCPAAEASIGTAVAQAFERGQMIWIGAQKKIYVLFADNAKPGWSVYTDDYIDGSPVRDDSISPPTGLDQPIRGFGLVWRMKPNVRERLGWARGAETAFEGAYQADSAATPDTMYYLRGRDGAVYALSAKSGKWTTLSATAAQAAVTTTPR